MRDALLCGLLLKDRQLLESTLELALATQDAHDVVAPWGRRGMVGCDTWRWRLE